MFQKLSDGELISSTKTLVAEERKLTARVLEHLREIERRRLFSTYGHPSLFEFCLSELGYSEGEAYARISAMRLSREVTEVLPAIESRSLSLTNLTRAQKFFRQEKQAGRPVAVEAKRELLAELQGVSTRQCERKLAEASAVAQGMPVVMKRMVTLEVDEATWVAFERVRELWGNQDLDRGQVLGKMAEIVLTKIDPDRKANKRAERSVGAPQPMEVVGNRADGGRWAEREHDAATGHRVAGGVAQGADELNPPAELITPSKRYIPAAVKSAVWQRDGGRCTEKDPRTGQLCGSRYAIQFHHLDEYAYGGAHVTDNLQLLKD